MNLLTRRASFALSCGLLLCSSTATIQAQAPLAAATAKPLAETPTQRDRRMEWFRDARFGMFIHWGVYSVPAGEYNGNTNYGEWFLEETKMPVSQYEKYAQQFNPQQFDARAWVRAAKDAGMKYIVITSKHHDGFAMYRSNLSDWGMRRTAFQRDPLKELAEACKKEGLKLCFYHSIMDWRHPKYLPRRAWNDVAQASQVEPDMNEYVKYMKGQLKELLTNYGPIGILWFDGEWESTWTHERGVDLYNYVRALQPNIIVNNRVGKGRSGMQGMDKGQGVGDYGTPEQEIPPTGFGPGVDWESCMTMNNHWGYNRADNNWKSSQTLVRNLIDCASKGGNYLLNVGPTAEGLIPGPSLDRLRDIGSWMKVNRAAVYETTASPFKHSPWGRATTKTRSGKTTLFLHVWNWPADGRLRVPGLKNRVASARLLGEREQKLAAQNFSDGVVVQVPQQAPNAISTTIALAIQGAPVVEEMPLAQNADGTLLLPPSEARMHGGIQIEQKANGQDNFGHWLSSQAWVEWSFRAVRPGKYLVSAEVAGTEAAAFDMILGTQKVRASVAPTGDYAKFQKVNLGTIEITSPGDALLQIKPADNWKPINLRSLSLTPAP
jgi:alpha-L-fucosidase